jgi:small-conductance mechanosensitive channel
VAEVRLPAAASFWADNRDVITAVATVVAAVVLAQLVDRTLVRRAAHLATSVAGGMSPVADTRLRLVRRLAYAAIILLGVALALSQFAAVKRVATGVLASSAVLGLVVGFAARQTLANAVAGILIAISQPIRIGDLVTFEGNTGVVEDIRLTYTYIACDDGRRVVVPNERLAQNTVENHTVADPRVRVEVSLFLPPEADAMRAIRLLGAEQGVDAHVAEVDKDGVRLVAAAWAPSPAERGALAAGLRVSCLEQLRREGLSSGAGA